MGDTVQKTQISGDNNQGYIAGRDLYLGDQYAVQETLFSEPDLSDVEPPHWTTTPKAEELARALSEDRLIVLAGQDLDDKTMVARHLAWLLRRDLPGEVHVREWYRSSDPQKIETAFHETATTILLLPQVQPHHVGHRLNELSLLLRSRRNFTIITTDVSRAEWGIRSGSPEEHFWHEISWETYYGRVFLTKALLEQLGEQVGRLPEWVPRELQTDSLLAEGLSIEDAAARLKQPDKIQRFVQWLRTENASSRDVLAQLDQLGGDEEAIFRWYRQLDRKDQLLAMGLVLFDGLPDDQIFAALEILVNDAWRQSDPNLPLFDYKDLDRLDAHFHLAESKEDGTRIETSSRQKRDSIIRAAWEVQRRRLLAVLPAMTRLLQDGTPHRTDPEPEATAQGKAPISRLFQKPEPAKSSEMWRFTRGAERELFSSPRRVEQLQRSIIESLSQIGLLSFEAVEATFLQFAVDSSAGLQTIVAKALAAWRGEGHSAALFKVLNAWWEDGCLAPRSKSQTQQTTREREDARAVMRATVAAATAYALQYDQPNQMAPELLALFKALLRDPHPVVRSRVLELTLPMATASHLRQLEPILSSQIISDRDHLYAIAFGAAMAYSLRPAETIEVIERWHAFCRAEVSSPASTANVTPRDKLLSATALVYGYIRLEQDQGILSAADIVSALRSILTQETNPFVRTHALMAMGLQAVDNFDLVSATLMELLSEVTLPDRLHVVTVLVRAYLKQRENMKGGDDEIDIDGRSFEVWTRSPRPLTAIETSLYSWLQDEQHPIAQQVSIQTFAAITATELDQKERALASRRAPVASPPGPAAIRISLDAPRLRKTSILGRMAVFLSTPRKKSTRDLILPILAEVIEVQRAERSRVFEGVAATASGAPKRLQIAGKPANIVKLFPVVLARWQAMGEEGVQELARAMSHALDFFRWRWAILLTAILSCGLLYHDVADWQWALGASLSPSEELTLQHRRAAPIRLAWNLSLPALFENQEHDEHERIAAEKAAAEQLAKAERLASAQPKPQPIVTPPPVVEVQPQPATVAEKPTEPSLTPKERLIRSALWLRSKHIRDNRFYWLLPALEGVQPDAEILADEQLPDMEPFIEEAAQEPTPSPPNPPLAVNNEPRQAQQSASPSQEADEPAASIAVQPASADREEIDQIAPTPEPEPTPTKSSRVRKWLKKWIPIKGPKGDGGGNR
jgi:hypothetical protein